MSHNSKLNQFVKRKIRAKGRNITWSIVPNGLSYGTSNINHGKSLERTETMFGELLEEIESLLSVQGKKTFKGVQRILASKLTALKKGRFASGAIIDSREKKAKRLFPFALASGQLYTENSGDTRNCGGRSLYLSVLGNGTHARVYSMRLNSCTAFCTSDGVTSNVGHLKLSVSRPEGITVTG